MTIPQLTRTRLEEACEMKELAGTDILVLSGLMQRETGLFPGDVVELRRENESPGQGMLCTVGLMTGGALSPDKLLIGVEAKALLSRRLERLPLNEDALIAAPVAQRELLVDAVLVQNGPEAKPRKDDAVLRTLHDWVNRKGGINADMEYRWQGEFRCIAIGSRPGGWGKVDIVKSRIFFIEEWEAWLELWRKYTMARDSLSRQAREAHLAVEGRNKLAKALLSRRDIINKKIMQRAAILVCLARTARLLEHALDKAKLEPLSHEANALWQRLKDPTLSQARQKITPLWTQTLIDGQGEAQPPFPISEGDSILTEYANITGLTWDLTRSRSQPEPPPSEPLRADLKEWTAQILEAVARFQKAAENTMNEKRELDSFGAELASAEDGIRNIMFSLDNEIKEKANKVKDSLIHAAELSLTEAPPWSAFLQKIAAEGKIICRDWGNMQDKDLPTWWQKLYGDISPEEALTNSNDIHFEPDGLALAQGIILAGNRLAAGIPSLSVAQSIDTSLQETVDSFL